MIEVTNVIKIYPGEVEVHALRGVSFTIPDGQFVALMGRSGSGKSTLLHQLGLLDDPTSGEIIIDGVALSVLSDEEKTAFRLAHVGYVFQEYGLIAELSALENVYLPGMALDKEGALARAKELLGYVGLGERLYNKPNELSGGEQQRVSIARSLINDPKIIFADEPTANLDSASTEMVLALFKKLHDELGKTIVMVTHEVSDRDIVDRIITLKDGKVIDDGTSFKQEVPKILNNSAILRP